MMSTNIVMFWFHDDWGRFGRAYERVAQHLARFEEVAHVTCVFPPISDQTESSRTRVSVRTVNDKLTLATEALITRRQPWLRRLTGTLGSAVPGSALRDHLRSQGFERENTILWLFPPHPYLDVIRTNIPHHGIVAHMIDDFTKFDPSHELHHLHRHSIQK